MPAGRERIRSRDIVPARFGSKTRTRTAAPLGAGPPFVSYASGMQLQGCPMGATARWNLGLEGRRPIRRAWDVPACRRSGGFPSKACRYVSKRLGRRGPGGRRSGLRLRSGGRNRTRVLPCFRRACGRAHRLRVSRPCRNRSNVSNPCGRSDRRSGSGRSCRDRSMRPCRSLCARHAF